MTKNSNTKEVLKKASHLIDNWLNFQTYVKEIPGVAVGIFVEDEIIFKKEYGYANLEAKTKLTSKHLFRIASHSKLFTATAIMKLYHDEKLSIDDKISKHLPWFKSEKDENMQHIRIRHLLTHASGITRDGRTAHWENYSFPGIEDIQKQVQEGISFFEVNEILKYSNVGFTILGQIIEKVSGMTYHEFIQKEILDPLEMTNTITQINDENIKNHATGYTIKYPNKNRKPIEHIQAEVMHSATGLSSNVEDLLKFYQAHFLGSGKLFPDYIKREMQRTQFKTKSGEWGLGFSITKAKESTIVGHGGGYPGFITRSGFDPKNKIIVVVLTNAIDGPALNLLFGLINFFSYLIKEQKEFELQKDEIDKDFSDIIGFYESVWGTSLFSQIGSRLVLITPSAVEFKDFLQIYEFLEDYKFKAPKDKAFSSPGQEIEFIDGPDGEKIFLDSHRGKNKRFTFSL